jgi:hypothetical protein
MQVGSSVVSLGNKCSVKDKKDAKKFAGGSDLLEGSFITWCTPTNMMMDPHHACNECTVPTFCCFITVCQQISVHRLFIRTVDCCCASSCQRSLKKVHLTYLGASAAVAAPKYQCFVHFGAAKIVAYILCRPTWAGKLGF